MKIWVCSDHHFGHKNILNFTRADGSKLRDFPDVDTMHMTMVQRHNEVVSIEDHVYFLGDVAINKYALKWIHNMNGHKRLVRGNHDIFKTKEYLDAGFHEIYGCRVWPKHNLIFSHIPLHPDCLSGRGWTCIHGHLHSNLVMTSSVSTLTGDLLEYPDKRYRNVCVEQTDYYPVLIMQ